MDISTQEAMQMQCHLYQLGLRPIFVHDSVADDTLFTLWKMKFLHVRCRVCRVWNVRRSMRVERRWKRNLIMILLMYQLFLECQLPPRQMWWVHPMNQPRGLPSKGEFHAQIQELNLCPDRFMGYFCMPMNKYFELPNLIKNHRKIAKQNTNWRKSISTEERLTVFLR